jgi:hypothetical protein
VSIFKRRRFPVEIILVCVRWYCKYRITYRDLAEMMQERGVEVDSSTIFRWVQRYEPELEKRIRWYQRLPLEPPGEWTKPMSRSVDSGSTCSAPSTSMPVDRLHAAGPP